MAPDISAYISVMEEIKRRTEVISFLQRKELTLKYPAVQVESMVLQVRMILELIALASLAAHKVIFEQHQKKFESHWDPVRILKDVEKLNPSFYPVPILESPSKTPGIVNDLSEVKKGFLTREELIQIHGRCGNILHARNPYGKRIDYSSYETAVPRWMERIRTLLNCHRIQLLNDEVFYLVHMKENQDDRVHMYTFGRVSA